jgi:hypothetical protein
MNNIDAATLLAVQEDKISSLEKEILRLTDQANQTNQVLAKLVPGFAEESGISPSPEPQPMPVSEPATGKVSVQPVEEMTVVYFKATRDDVMKGYQLAEESMKARGVNLDEHPFFGKVRSNPADMQKMVDEVLTAFNKAVEVRADLDRSTGSKVEVR